MPKGIIKKWVSKDESRKEDYGTDYKAAANAITIQEFYEIYEDDWGGMTPWELDKWDMHYLTTIEKSGREIYKPYDEHLNKNMGIYLFAMKSTELGADSQEPPWKQDSAETYNAYRAWMKSLWGSQWLKDELLSTGKKSDKEPDDIAKEFYKVFYKVKTTKTHFYHPREPDDLKALFDRDSLKPGFSQEQVSENAKTLIDKANLSFEEFDKQVSRLVREMIGDGQTKGTFKTVLRNEHKQEGTITNANNIITTVGFAHLGPFGGPSAAQMMVGGGATPTQHQYAMNIFRDLYGGTAAKAAGNDFWFHKDPQYISLPIFAQGGMRIATNVPTGETRWSEAEEQEWSFVPHNHMDDVGEESQLTSREIKWEWGCVQTEGLSEAKCADRLELPSPITGPVSGVKPLWPKIRGQVKKLFSKGATKPSPIPGTRLSTGDEGAFRIKTVEDAITLIDFKEGQYKSQMSWYYRTFFTDPLDNDKKITSYDMNTGYVSKDEFESSLGDGQLPASDGFLLARDLAAMEIFRDFATRYETIQRIIIFNKISQETVRGTDPTAIDGAEISKNIRTNINRKLSKSGGITAAGDIEEGEEQLTAKQIRERQKFFKQCALLMNMSPLKSIYRDTIRKNTPSSIHGFKKNTSPFKGRFWMVDSKSKKSNRKDIINKLITPRADAVQPFLNITPDIAAALVPKIRLFKVYNDVNGKLKEFEFLFENFESPDRIKNLKSISFDKGNGAGIKDFSFTYEGSNPATSRNDIKANLKLYFQSFNDFIRERPIYGCKSGKIASGVTPYKGLWGAKGYYGTKNPKTGEPADDCKWKFADLLLFPKHSDDLHAERFLYDASHYRIRADVGWQLRDDKKFKNLLSPRTKALGITNKITFNNALERMNKSFYLNMVDHEFDIRPDGTVEMNIEYRAYIESIMKSPSLDALWTPEVEQGRRNARLRLKKAKQENCTEAQMRAIQRALTAREAVLVKKSYQSIMKRLMGRGCIWQSDISKKAAREFQDFGTFSRIPIIKNIISGRDGSGRPGEKKKLADLKTSENRINFFFMGDLIYTILDCIYVDGGDILKQEMDKTKFILSTFEYTIPDPKYQTDTFNANIADIPISTDYFFEWMTQNVLKPERKSYPVLNFIRDLTNDLILEALSEVCFKRDFEKKLRFQTSTFLGLSDKGKKDPFDKMWNQHTSDVDVDLHYARDRLPLKSDSLHRTTDNFYHYLVVYPIMSTLIYDGIGKYKEDGNNGVHHLQIGSDRGLVKSVKFAKTDMQYIREARFFRNGQDGLMQLGAVYKVTVEMIGNTLYYPGMTVWIDPTGIGGKSPNWDPRNGPDRSGKGASAANALGFGGYHIITRVNSSLGPGNFTTTIEAQFDYSGDGSKKRQGAQNPLGKPEGFKEGEQFKLEKRSTNSNDPCVKMLSEIEEEVIAGRILYEQTDRPPLTITDEGYNSPYKNKVPKPRGPGAGNPSEDIENSGDGGGVSKTDNREIDMESRVSENPFQPTPDITMPMGDGVVILGGEGEGFQPHGGDNPKGGVTVGSGTVHPSREWWRQYLIDEYDLVAVDVDEDGEYDWEQEGIDIFYVSKDNLIEIKRGNQDFDVNIESDKYDLGLQIPHVEGNQTLDLREILEEKYKKGLSFYYWELADWWLEKEQPDLTPPSGTPVSWKKVAEIPVYNFKDIEGNTFYTAWSSAHFNKVFSESDPAPTLTVGQQGYGLPNQPPMIDSMREGLIAADAEKTPSHRFYEEYKGDPMQQTQAVIKTAGLNAPNIGMEYGRASIEADSAYSGYDYIIYEQGKLGLQGGGRLVYQTAIGSPLGFVPSNVGGIPEWGATPVLGQGPGEKIIFDEFDEYDTSQQDDED